MTHFQIKSDLDLDTVSSYKSVVLIKIFTMTLIGCHSKPIRLTLREPIRGRVESIILKIHLVWIFWKIVSPIEIFQRKIKN